MTDVVLDAGKVRPVNGAAEKGFADPIANVPASVDLRVHRRAGATAAIVLDAKDPAEDAGHVTIGNSANGVNRQYRCLRWALLCFRTTEELNRSPARFE